MSAATTASLVTHSEQQTEAAARRLAADLRPGQIVVLTGPLGAGKTAFVRGLAQGLGIDPRHVHSPSFTIVGEYGPSASGRRLVHADLYRIDGAAEIEDLGLADYLDGGWVVAVEWGEKLPARFLEEAVRITIEDAGEDVRRLTIVTPAPAGGS